MGEAKRLFAAVAAREWVPEEWRDTIRNFKVAASNDINEATLQSLNEQGHGIDIYGIGTNLVTCQAQPALGMVYKLVELNGEPRMKLSQEFSKVSVPCRKTVYRLYSAKDQPLIDLMQRVDEPKPQAGERIFCRNLFDETRRCYVTPSRVEELLVKIWAPKEEVSGVYSFDTKVQKIANLEEARAFSLRRLAAFRQDILRPLNPTPHKLSVSDSFFTFFKQMWQKQAPVKELS